jgi:hypothetical protein
MRLGIFGGKLQAEKEIENNTPSAFFDLETKAANLTVETMSSVSGDLL